MQVNIYIYIDGIYNFSIALCEREFFMNNCLIFINK